MRFFINPKDGKPNSVSNQQPSECVREAQTKCCRSITCELTSVSLSLPGSIGRRFDWSIIGSTSATIRIRKPDPDCSSFNPSSSDQPDLRSKQKSVGSNQQLSLHFKVISTQTKLGRHLENSL